MSMSNLECSSIVLTHWNAGVFRATALPQLLPELAVYSLLYDEVLVREEDLITNRAITDLLSDENNFRLFSELLANGLVKLLRLPLEAYPPGRRFDPTRLPVSARVEEHQLRRSYKGSRWQPTQKQWQLFQRLDQIVALNPPASRHHSAFPTGNPFAAQLGEILENRRSYRLKSHPVFRYLDERTADQFAAFCRNQEEWLRFMRDQGARDPIVGPDAGFYRSAAYQCSTFLPTPRAIRRLVESVYAATYCERESADGRYGGSELVELPFRYRSEHERIAATDEARRIEVVATGASAGIPLRPGFAAALARTRASPQFSAVRSAIQALGKEEDSPLLTEARFREAWRDLCQVHSENAALQLGGAPATDHKIALFTAMAYVLARVQGVLVLPAIGLGHEPVVAQDALAIAAIEKLGPKLLSGFRSMVRIPALRAKMESSVDVRCSNVPLTLPDAEEQQRRRPAAD